MANSLLLFFFFFSHLIYYLHPSVLSLLVVIQIRGHIAGSSPPLPTTVRALHFYREEISALSSLVDSPRIVLTHARRSQQLIPFFIFAKKIKISPRRDSNSRINTISSSIRGLPLVHRGRNQKRDTHDSKQNVPVGMYGLLGTPSTLIL